MIVGVATMTAQALVKSVMLTVETASWPLTVLESDCSAW